MNTTAKKLIAVATIAAFSVLGTAVPAQAVKMPQRTIWCC